MSLLETATGRPVDVNTDNQLAVAAMTMTVGWKRVLEDAEMWSLPISATPTGADDHFFHLQNDYEDRYIMVVDISLLRASTSEDVEILPATGTATSPTAITPVNWQVGATRQPQATAENGADLQLTVTATEILATLTIGTTRASFAEVNYNTPLCLAPGAAFVLNAVTGTAAITGNVLMLAV